MAAIQIRKVSSGYSEQEVLHNLDLSISEPSIYVVLGPNGAGKTTLFRTVCGILKPFAGEVTLDGVDVYGSRASRERMCYLSHLNALPEEMTVGKALEFFCDIYGGDANNAIDKLDLRPLVNHKLAKLSQGQKKRVSVARLLLKPRDAYLLDEPTTSLDPAFARETRDLLLDLSKDRVVLYSTHNLYEAKEIGSFLIVLGDGNIRFSDKMENVRASRYRIGIRSTSDLTKIMGAEFSNGYYIMTVQGPEEVGRIVSELVGKGIVITEVKEIDNPLEDFFEARA